MSVVLDLTSDPFATVLGTRRGSERGDPSPADLYLSAGRLRASRRTWELKHTPEFDAVLSGPLIHYGDHWQLRVHVGVSHTHGSAQFAVLSIREQVLHGSGCAVKLIGCHDDLDGAIALANELTAAVTTFAGEDPWPELRPERMSAPGFASAFARLARAPTDRSKSRGDGVAGVRTASPSPSA